MCGIVGIMTKRHNGLFNSDLDIFTDMLFADQVRGAHGTGIFYDVDKKANVFKGAMPSSAFLRHETTQPVLKEIVQKSNFAIGHNRHATKGGISFDNTHPFIVENTTLIHNGTLSYHKGLKDVEVDSHAICHSINDIGHVETLKKIDGAFALVWYDGVTEKLHFIRNTERPLHIIETNDLFVISSEAGLAEWILKRRNAFKIGETKMCEVGQLYTYDPQKNKLTNTKMEIKSKTVYYYGNGMYKGQPLDYEEYPAPVATNNKTSTPARLSDPKYDYIDVRIGDEVIFSPIEVNPRGKTFQLSGLVERIIYKNIHEESLDKYSQLICHLYNSEQDKLNQYLDHALCKGTVIQVVYKGSDKAVTIKDVRPVIQKEKAAILLPENVATTIN